LDPAFCIGPAALLGFDHASDDLRGDRSKELAKGLLIED
jgi:hypothetical protein